MPREVVVEKTSNGTVNVDKTEAYLEEQVTIEPVANEGYEVGSVKVNGVELNAECGWQICLYCRRDRRH